MNKTPLVEELEKGVNLLYEPKTKAKIRHISGISALFEKETIFFCFLKRASAILAMIFFGPAARA